MKIVCYTREAEPRVGFLIDDMIYDIEASSSFLDMEVLPSDLLTILSSGQTDLLQKLHGKLLKMGPKRTELPVRCLATLGGVRVCAPIPRPPKIICLGLNYKDHAEEQGAKVPETPLLFAKAPTAVIGQGEPIVIPKGAKKIDYEGELAFIIAKSLSKANARQAQEAIFGYCCMNDVTEREIQSRERVWFRSKSMDTFAPLGPWIVTSDQLENPLDLTITTKVNSEVMQSGSTTNLIFAPVDIIVFATRTISLEPGDIISTGTPSGVGVFRKPQVFLKDGDSVEITIEGIGTLSNPVRKES